MKKRFFVLMLSLMLCISMLSPVFADAAAEETGVFNLPGSLQDIRDEAFEGISSAEKVVVPEGTKRIGSRAFADSTVEEVYLPESIEFIADDAFEGSDDITVYVHRGSAAHEYLNRSDVRYSVIEPELGDGGVYAIYSAEYVERIDENGAAAKGFLVTVDTTDACDVQVSLLDETDGDVLLVFKGSAEANLRSGGVTATMDGEFAMPSFYVLEAKLIGANGEVLCTYTSHKHTARHAEIENKTAADYTGEVVTFGSAGYGVLEEGVVQLNGVQSGSGYIVSHEGISEGDVLLVKVGGKHKAVKVKSYTDNGDGTVTVQPDDTIEMGDVYRRLDIDGYMQPVDGITPAYNDESGITVIPVNPTFKTGPLSIEGKLEFSVKLKFLYEKKEKYFYTECWAGHSGSIEVTVDVAGLDTRDLDKRLAPVFFDKGIGIPGLDTEAKLTVSLPIDLDFSAGGSAYVKYESKSGFRYNSDDKILEKIKEDSSEAYAKAEGDVTITVGPEIMLRAQLWDWLSAKIWGQIGLEAVGEVGGLQYGGGISTETPDKIHACDGCLDCDINIIAGIWGSLECTAIKNLEVKLLDAELFVLRGKIAKAFYSFLNDEHSPYGGEPVFGFGLVANEEGVCRNMKYRADISTVDYTDSVVTKVPVTSTGVYGEVQEGLSPCTMYLYPGSNSFAAQFENSLISAKVTMPEKAKAVTITEPPVSVSLLVQDENTEKALSGVQVLLETSGGIARSGVTNADGVVTFDKLPEGNYSFDFSKSGYESKTVSDKYYTAGSKNSLTVYMVSNELPVLTAYAESAGTVQALTSDGTCPSGVPKVTLTVTETDYGFIEVVVVRHENCEGTLRFSGTYIGYVDLFAVDMGDGKYTYVLGLGNAGTGGGCDIMVFREENGVLKTYDLSLGDIDVEGVFSDDTHFSATIQPRNISVSGTMPLPYDGFKRKGHELSPMGSGNMDYVKNEDGAYDLIYSLRIAAGGYNWDNIGSCKTRFALKDNAVVMDSQWFEMYEGGTLN